ncbi:hypothetical protein DM02DRAFT_640148 [Periconia macrospinosa]|uniref:Uncharacterized protein n=1 Tax=Periconia macrospinosa TaxID=97972 RepID=A0A2V1E107_9PLEO|nr:hypothetical protein DM02DRAFT_640148 [Periconia macrospinosa]
MYVFQIFASLHILTCLDSLFYLERVYHAWGTLSSNVIDNTTYDPGSTLRLAWLANSPQVVLSFLYFSINSECTSMAGTYEWNNMASSRKGLRVTKPFREQRSTYFLQLPLRFSLPMTAISGLLHWLLSQSIFLLRIDVIDRQGKVNEKDSKSGCGYSGVSFLVLCAIFYIFMIVVGLIGRKHMNVQIPFAASCSLVISAACHVPPSEQDPQLKKVQWGVVKERLFDGELHCCISSEQVEKPVAGTVYR